MRAITVQQPFAFAIAVGSKTVENRRRRSPWNSAVGERIAVHAGKTWFDGAELDPQVRALMERSAASLDGGKVYGARLLTLLLPQGHHLGSVVAVAVLRDVHWWGTCASSSRQPTVDGPSPVDGGPSLCTPWSRTGAWHLVLDDVAALAQPVPARGMQGLWNLPADVELTVQAAAPA